jgi:hypothetical protein
MAQKSIKKTLLSLSVAVALGCGSGSIFADGDRVEELEIRVAELEALVLRMLENQQAVEAVEAVEVEVVAAAVAEEKVNAMMAQHEEIEAEKVHKHSYKFGGYIKADFMYSDYGDGSVSGGSAGRDFYIPATVPVGGQGESYLDFNATESRINFRSTHLLDNGAKVSTFLEMDFQLSPGGDERISNSYNPRMRHAFVTYNKWLVGQTWMTFYNVGTNPENLDFVGPADGSLFGRQVQIRYTNGPWMVSVENPETTITPFGGGGRIVVDDNQIPDAVLRYNLKGDWGQFSAAGIVRQLAYENNAAGIDDKTTGYAISLTGKHMVGQNDDIRWMVSTGKGMGRYIGLNTANGAVLDADGNLHGIDSTGAFGSYRHIWNEKWRSNLTLSALWIDNDVDLTGSGVTKDVRSGRVNLIYSPLPKLDFGIEFMYAKRKLESGLDGDLKRVQFSAKYAY